MTTPNSRDESRGPDSAPGRFAYDGLERLIHEKARLGILASLSSRPEGLLFPELKELCSLTDGNLSRHLQVLHEAGLVEVWKSVKRNRPQTLCRLTELGRQRFLDYVTVLENVVDDAARVVRSEPSTATSPGKLLADGWSQA